MGLNHKTSVLQTLKSFKNLSYLSQKFSYGMGNNLKNLELLKTE